MHTLHPAITLLSPSPKTYPLILTQQPHNQIPSFLPCLSSLIYYHLYIFALVSLASPHFLASSRRGPVALLRFFHKLIKPGLPIWYRNRNSSQLAPSRSNPPRPAPQLGLLPCHCPLHLHSTPYDMHNAIENIDDTGFAFTCTCILYVHPRRPATVHTPHIPHQYLIRDDELW